MAFWDGDRWISEVAEPKQPSRGKKWLVHRSHAVLEGGLVAVLIAGALVFFAPQSQSAFDLSGAQAANAAARHRYPGTLVATPGTVETGDYITVSGCDYDTALGNVIVSFGGGGWGSPLDANGCFSIPYIPASVKPGTYDITAMQFVRNRWRETGETSLTVLPLP